MIPTIRAHILLISGTYREYKNSKRGRTLRGFVQSYDRSSEFSARSKEFIEKLNEGISN